MGWPIFGAFIAGWSVAWFWLTGSAERDRLNAMRPGAILDGCYEAKRQKVNKQTASVPKD